jgi:hypothetical protein
MSYYEIVSYYPSKPITSSFFYFFCFSSFLYFNHLDLAFSNSWHTFLMT